MKKQAFNPYLPSYEYIPDGEPYVFDRRVYVYGSHDRFDGEGFCLNDYVTWSAPVDDPGNWRYEGVIFRREQDPMNPEGKYPLFAPDVQKGNDGRYYLYYSPAGMGTVGVAVCDTPGGEYAFHGHVTHPDGAPLGTKPGDANPFDPGAFIDDDGRVYLYTGFAPGRPMPGEEHNTPGPFVSELAQDMHTIIGEPQKVVLLNVPSRIEGQWGDHDFFEASSLRKINGKYYFIYSSHNGHELCYAIGESPVGPFTYGGVIHSNGDIGYQGRTAEQRLNYSGNNHGSLVQIGTQWYIFGHRMTNYTAYSRQAVAEPVVILPDGSIPQVEMTSCGLNGGPLQGLGTYGTYIACNLYSAKGALHVFGPALANSQAEHPVFRQDGVDREDTPDQHIANLHEGSVAGFKYFDFRTTTKISAITRGNGGVLSVHTDLTAAPLATIPLTAGTDWHESVTVDFPVPSGVHALYFVYHGDGKTDWLSFTLA